MHIYIYIYIYNFLVPPIWSSVMCMWNQMYIYIYIHLYMYSGMHLISTVCRISWAGVPSSVITSMYFRMLPWTPVRSSIAWSSQASEAHVACSSGSTAAQAAKQHGQQYIIYKGYFRFPRPTTIYISWNAGPRSTSRDNLFLWHSSLPVAWRTLEIWLRGALDWLIALAIPWGGFVGILCQHAGNGTPKSASQYSVPDHSLSQAHALQTMSAMNETRPAHDLGNSVSLNDGNQFNKSTFSKKSDPSNQAQSSQTQAKRKQLTTSNQTVVPPIFKQS